MTKTPQDYDNIVSVLFRNSCRGSSNDVDYRNPKLCSV